jgi:NADH:ubiquinone oxidoreductase subunit F (NADH-binding)
LGRGRIADIEMLATISDYISKNALCGLGQAVSIPVHSMLKNFYDKYVKACAPFEGCA